MPAEFSLLIVEDDDDARRNMEDLLSLDGYQVESVSHCLPAINAVETRHFDAVIIDWRLPDGNGGDLIGPIRRSLPNSPVIVVTGLRDFEMSVRALREGAYDLISKPINPDALRGLISRLVERKHHLEEIETAQAKLVANERLAAIGQMVAGLAHESRNAFQRCHACLAELTLDLQTMPESLQLVQKVQKALDDIHQLLEEVRNYSAPINLELDWHDVGSLVSETWRQISEVATGPPLPQLEIQQQDEVPQRWFVDKNRCRQTLRNLLENAIHASNEGDTVKVRLSQSAVDRADLLLDVMDQGDGVAKDMREQIFTPFFTTKTKGTGLGLAISRRIAEAHGGSLTVTDADQGGARFTFRIPNKPQRSSS